MLIPALSRSKALSVAALVTALAVSLAAAPHQAGWRMKADYVEACSCDLFCPCYFNSHAQHPYCHFNMAVTVKEGHSGNVNLAGVKYWLTGDLGNKWGTDRKANWVVVTFDPSVTKAQRDAIAPMILKTYGFDWSELKVREAPIEIKLAGDIAEASLGGGQLAYMKLKREPGADGKGVVLKNVNYFGARSNDGFWMYKSVEHRADLEGHKFYYSGKNAFLISIVSEGSGTADAGNLPFHGTIAHAHHSQH